MGLDQFLYKINCSAEEFESNKELRDNVRNNMSSTLTNDKLDSISYCYYRKCYPLDDILLTLTSTVVAENVLVSDFYIPKSKLKELYETCFEVVHAVPEVNHLTAEQILLKYNDGLDFTMTLERWYKNAKQRSNLDMMINEVCPEMVSTYSDIFWDMSYFYNTFKFLHALLKEDDKNSNDNWGLYYERSI